MLVNGYELEVDPGAGTAPIVNAEGRVLVPVRAIVESIGGTADWNDELQQIILQANNKKVIMNIGDNSYSVNDDHYQMDAAPAIINRRAMLPLRFVGEALECKISWFPERQEILISYPLLRDRLYR